MICGGTAGMLYPTAAGETFHVVSLIYKQRTLSKRGAADMTNDIRIEGTPVGINSIYLDDGDTLLHELIHHSRMVDESRDSLLLRTRSRSDAQIRIPRNDRSLEEAATILEALARQNDYMEPSVPGYHSDESVSKGRDPFESICNDRTLVAGSAELGSKGLKGMHAKKAVTDNFRCSDISNLILSEHGQISAKDRLDEIEKKENNIKIILTLSLEYV